MAIPVSPKAGSCPQNVGNPTPESFSSHGKQESYLPRYATSIARLSGPRFGVPQLVHEHFLVQIHGKNERRRHKVRTGVSPVSSAPGPSGPCPLAFFRTPRDDRQGGVPGSWLPLSPFRLLPLSHPRKNPSGGSAKSVDGRWLVPLPNGIFGSSEPRRLSMPWSKNFSPLFGTSNIWHLP